MDKLSPASLEQLEKFLPDDKIIMKYQELKENIDELDNSEQFLVIVCQVFDYYFDIDLRWLIR